MERVVSHDELEESDPNLIEQMKRLQLNSTGDITSRMQWIVASRDPMNTVSTMLRMYSGGLVAIWIGASVARC